MVLRRAAVAQWVPPGDRAYRAPPYKGVRGRRGQPRTPGAPLVALGWRRGVPPTAVSPYSAAGPRQPSGLFAGCHVIQRERPQPFPGISIPAPAALRAAEGRSWPWHGPSGVGAVSARPDRGSGLGQLLAEPVGHSARRAQTVGRSQTDTSLALKQGVWCHHRTDQAAWLCGFGGFGVCAVWRVWSSTSSTPPRPWTLTG